MAIERGWSDAEQAIYDESQKDGPKPVYGSPGKPGQPYVKPDGRRYDTQSFGGDWDAAGREVARYRENGAGMAGREAYQLNFGEADQDRAANLQARGVQNEANDLNRNAALGLHSKSYAYGQNLLNQGGQQQTAMAGSARGGPLAAMNAMRGVSDGRAAYAQQGNNALNANLADEMAAGRTAWNQGLDATRKMDQAGQQLTDEQAKMQAEAQARQNQLNQQGQLWSEGRGLAVNKAEMSGKLRSTAAKQVIGDAEADSDQAATDRAVGAVKDTGTTVAKLWGASDERLKSPASLGPIFNKKKNASYEDTSRNSSEELPSDEIVDDFRIEYGGQKADEAREERRAAPKPNANGYEGFMFGRSDPGNDNKPALHRGIEASIKRSNDAQVMPDERDPEPSTFEKKGLAARRAGQEGGMFGSPRPKVSTYDETHNVAPGTRDFLKYGTPRKDSEGVEKKGDAYSERVALSDEDAKKAASVVAKDITEPVSSVIDSVKTAVKPVSDALFSDPEPAKGPTVEKGGGLVAQKPKPPPLTEEEQRKKDEGEETYRRAIKASGGTIPTGGPGGPVRKMPEEHVSKPGPVGATIGGPGGPVRKIKPSDERSKESAGGTDLELQKDANRKLVGSTWKYKEGVGEDTEQVHHGQMAQNLEENPITATAVREDTSGFKKVDEFDKLNVTAAGVASLQAQQDDMAAELEKMSARRNRRT